MCFSGIKKSKKYISEFLKSFKKCFYHCILFLSSILALLCMSVCIICHLIIPNLFHGYYTIHCNLILL